MVVWNGGVFKPSLIPEAHMILARKAMLSNITLKDRDFTSLLCFAEASCCDLAGYFIQR